MVAFLIVLLVIVVLGSVAYGTQSRRRRIAVEGMAQTAILLEAATDSPVVMASITTHPLTDALTNLGTRPLLERDLAVYGGQVARYGLHVCVALIDIDDFKRFNDQFGMARGDEILVAVAERIASRSRSGDSIYRLGGDEFICLLPEQTLETGAKVVERMKRSIEELAIPFRGSAGGIVTVSAGLAILDAEHLKASDELLREAEAALLQSQ
jgi:two-component system cell cycle response regulator